MPTKDVNSIVPKDLADDPTLLLHKRGYHNEDLTPFDGKCGAVIDEGNMFVITPNMDIIYDPPLGKNRRMSLREDLRFGDDDPWQWPQPYSSSLCHYGAIPRCPIDPNDPLRVMWWTPTPESFVRSTTSIITGIGRLNDRTFNSFHRLITTLQSRVEAYKKDPKFPVTNHRVILIANSLQHAFARLESLSTNRRQMYFGVTQVQRCYLELVALLDYICIFKPRMDGECPPATSVSHTIGTYAFEATVIQEFVRAGLPVWTVRKYNVLPAYRIDSVQVPLPPNGLICTREADPKFPTFFVGAATDTQKYVELSNFVRSFVGYPNPFNTVSIEPRNDSTSGAGGGSVSIESRNDSMSGAGGVRTAQSSRKDVRTRPYIKRGAPRQPIRQSGRNKFGELSSPLIPPAIPAWRDALAMVDTDPQRLVYETRPTDSGYVFPDPGLFLGVSTPEKQATYFFNWLKHRTELMYRFSSQISSARPVSAQLWRDLLNFGGAMPDGTDQTATTKASARRQRIIEMLGDSIKAQGVEVSQTPSSVTDVFWREQQLSAGVVPSQEITQEILWELSELNFRFEFLALDQRASGNQADEDTRHEQILACFPGGSLLIVDFDNATGGLGADSWAERTPYILAMARVMQKWSNAPPALLAIVDKPVEHHVEEDVLSIETMVTQFYTQSFFNYFARAAIVPRRLNGVAAGA